MHHRVCNIEAEVFKAIQIVYKNDSQKADQVARRCSVRVIYIPHDGLNTVLGVHHIVNAHIS